MKSIICGLLVVLCLLVNVESKCVGQVHIAGEGPTYVMSPGGDGARISGNTSLELKYDSGATYTQQCAEKFTPDIFRRFYVLDKSLSFTADVSAIGCGCNAAFYFILAPAINANQQPDPTQCGDYYCDANHVCGIYCPEIDLMEANRAAMQVTPHRCNAPQGKHYTWCDGSGCGVNTKYLGNNYGYGTKYVINTQHPFNVTYHFKTTGGIFSSMTTTVSQGSKQFSFTHDEHRCGNGYLSSLTDAFKQGLVLTTSYWSGNTGSVMSWLDVPPCSASEGCAKAGSAVFSNIRVF